MMSLWDALRMNMMISYQELVRTFPNTTIEKDASANDNARKSAIMSGLIIKRLPLRNVYPSFLISLNIARSSDLSNQNMRLPQHISRMVAGALTAPRPENYPDRKPVCAA